MFHKKTVEVLKLSASISDKNVVFMCDFWAVLQFIYVNMLGKYYKYGILFGKKIII